MQNRSYRPVETPTPVEIAAKAPEPIEEVTYDTAGFAQRGQQPIITLTDMQERSLQGEILDVTESHLKVRRQSDLYIVQVPVTMLCTEDQAFAVYLFKEQNGIASPESKTQADIIWDEIFKGM